MDKEMDNRNSERRELLKQGSKALKTLGNLIPLATFILPVLPDVANAQVESIQSDSLNLILSVEYLQSEFYKAADVAGAMANLPQGIKGIFTRIRVQQDAHIKYLNTILGPAVNPKSSFNFNAVDMRTSDTFLIYSQAFEELGVRTYKEVIAEIIDKKVLNSLIRMHSTESRHAAMLRILRGKDVWITNNNENDSLLTDILKVVYKEEFNLKQAGLDLSTDTNYKNYSKEMLSEAFDEPLKLTDVNYVINKFK